MRNAFGSFNTVGVIYDNVYDKAKEKNWKSIKKVLVK